MSDPAFYRALAAGDPVALRTLAASVATYGRTDATRCGVLRAAGWERHWKGFYFKRNPHDLREWDDLPNPFDSLDASAALLPEGWSISRMDHGYRDRVEVDAIKRGLPTIRARGHDEKAARTVLALEAMAVDAEYQGQPMAWDVQA